MFRSRFTEAFPKSLTNIGPQELERDIVANPPGEGVEHFLCALLGLLLNRKQDVKYVVLAASLRRSSTIPKLTYIFNIELDTTSVHLVRLFRHIRRNGPKIGRVRILCLVVLRLAL